MKYGKRVTVSRQGFHIDSRLLQAVRILDNSRCRGVFITKNGNKTEKKDLIISPFPFSSWGCITRLQILVKSNNSTENIKDILSLLVKHNFNILSTNFTFGGHKHKTFDLVGELYEMRPKIKEIRFCENEEHKEKLMYKFRVNLYEKMNHLKDIIDTEFKEMLYIVPDKYTDAQRENIKKYLHEKNSRISFNDFNKIDEKQQIESVYWGWFKGLAFCAFKIKEGDETLYFNYCTKKSLLSLENKKIDREFLKNFSNNNNDIPILALSTFDAEKGYIRLRSFSQAIYEEEILQIDFSYKIGLIKVELIDNKNLPIKEQVIEEINEHGSLGMTRDLLGQIIQFIQDKNHDSFELLGISTQELSRTSALEEQGLISIQGLFKTKNKRGWQPKEFNAMKSNICEYIEGREHPKNQYIHSLKINIKKVFPYTVFISIRENFKQRMTFKPHDILKKEGLCARTSGTYTDEVTENVIKDMSICDACIQIYSLSVEEIEKIKRDGERTDFVPDNSWLLFEFGIARTKKMPIVRMIDVTHLNKKQWVQYLRTDNDKLLIEFDSTTKKMSLKNKMREAAQNLLQTLEKK
ncbi:MAG: hypothetical protein KAU26_05280 [Methylococcales bacterium]|nr:hypothetical protein [Methylococcales bacterium]